MAFMNDTEHSGTCTHFNPKTKITLTNRPKNEQPHFGCPRTGRFTTFVSTDKFSVVIGHHFLLFSWDRASFPTFSWYRTTFFFHFFLRPDLTFHFHVEIGPLFHLFLRSDFSFQFHVVIFHHFSHFWGLDISSIWDRTSISRIIVKPLFPFLPPFLRSDIDSKKAENDGRKVKKGLAIIRWNSGPTPVARGGSGAKAPPLAARPSWQVVNRQLLRLLSTYFVVYYRLPAN